MKRLISLAAVVVFVAVSSVPKQVGLSAGQEVSWVVQLMTSQGNKVAGGFKTCLKGVARTKKA